MATGLIEDRARPARNGQRHNPAVLAPPAARPARPPRPASPRPAPRRQASPRPAPRRQASPRPALPRPGLAPPAARPDQQAQPHRPAARGLARSRAPFVLLLIGLLGGGLVSLLVINTTLAQGAFEITAMQHRNSALAQQEQALQQQVASQESPGALAVRAEQLGMRPAGRLRFINLRTGQILSQPAQVPGVIPVPGYTP